MTAVKSNALESSPAAPLRVMQLASGDLWAGAEVQVFNLSSHLHIRGDVDVHVVLLNHGELEQRLQARGVAVIVFDESEMSGLTILRRLATLVREWHPHVLHTHRTKENILGGVVATLNRVHSLRTVHGRAESDLSRFDFRRRLLRFVDFFCGRCLQQGVVAVSDDFGKELATRFGRDRVSVVYNGVELPPTTQQLQKLNLDDAETPIDVAVVARLVSVKRLDLVIEAAAELNAYERGRFRFTLYGDGPLRESLEAEVTRLGLQHVVTLAGFCSNITQRLRRHHALLITSDHEGLPTNLLEAMSLGVPVISRAVGAIPSVLMQGRAGTLFDDAQAGAIARVLTATFNDTDGLYEKSERARQHATRYSAERMAEQYRDTYLHVLGRGRTAAEFLK